jgi:predicted RNase H-like nuclease (RuvC/YqgF family)
MHINIWQFPAVQTAVAAAVTALAAQVWRLVGSLAHSVKDVRLRSWVETLVQAAESSATAPSTGPQKQAWVVARLRALFPGVPVSVLTDMVEAAVVRAGSAR